VRWRVTAAPLLAVLTSCSVTSGPPAPTATPGPPGSFSFGVLGDAPYNSYQEVQYRIVLEDLEQHDLVSVIHIGDLFAGPCSDAMYAKSHERLDRLRHPVVYTPGDNEWFDCWESGASHTPLDRLAQLRKVFFTDPTHSLGRNKMPLASQSARPENACWRQGPIVFATTHVIGSSNGMRSFPGRTEADDAEVRQRTESAAAWVREVFAEAAATEAAAVVLALHANAFQRKAPAEGWSSFEPFRTTLAEEVGRFPRPVLVVHGDQHEYRVDHPLPAAPNLTRLEVPGSPDVGWVRVTVIPGATVGFSFENRVVPVWKYR
jgi:hypothetical protein